MKKVLFTSFSEREKIVPDESYIFYENNDANSSLILLRRFSPLFLFLFFLPFIFAYLFFTHGAVNQIFKLGLLVFLEISTWIIDLWIKGSFDRSNLILTWLVQIPIVFLIFFSLYVSF